MVFGSFRSRCEPCARCMRCQRPTKKQKGFLHRTQTTCNNKAGRNILDAGESPLLTCMHRSEKSVPFAVRVCKSSPRLGFDCKRSVEVLARGPQKKSLDCDMLLHLMSQRTIDERPPIPGAVSRLNKNASLNGHNLISPQPVNISILPASFREAGRIWIHKQSLLIHAYSCTRSTSKVLCMSATRSPTSSVRTT
ncbi:uncharacterized protein EI90DRAFT_3058062 [Cantharellus anzutake]|uniref:uncharacterized protein n=1 Tax=Cantharellus anzutake TaxID=1750568 RepID=UPI001903DD99|nr:uncharacterized protein EI90DRAFT_3058062 [Cantharellus anzutake]KAF8331487.1 hypothetical protein EI90DRAFT_3058062 [Cantharellus anzutake]